jgi:hypothetical protein
MMKKLICALLIAVVGFSWTACGGKKKSEDIIAPRQEKVTPQGPISMQEYTDSREVPWIGKQYRVAVHRQSCDSLPKVKDETGQAFVDNAISVAITRQDGSIFFTRRFTKKDFLNYLDADYTKTGILEGLVFDKANGDWLEFAASVSHPQTDEYIPLVVRISRMGEVAIARDTSLDTTSDSKPEAEEEDI